MGVACAKVMFSACQPLSAQCIDRRFSTTGTSLPSVFFFILSRLLFFLSLSVCFSLFLFLSLLSLQRQLPSVQEKVSKFSEIGKKKGQTMGKLFLHRQETNLLVLPCLQSGC